MVRAILRREDDDDLQQLLDAEEDNDEDYSPAGFQPETPAANTPSIRTRDHRTTPDIVDGFSSP